MLFTQLMNELLKRVDPKPLAALSYHENLAMLKEAGMSWPEITRRMVAAGMLEYKVTTHLVRKFGTVEQIEQELNRPWEERKNYAKPAHDYRNWCKREKRPQSYTDWRVYRREFSNGFEQGVESQMRRMRREQEDAYDKDHDAGGMALVVRDIRNVIRDFTFEEFPDLKPHEEGCQCRSCTSKRKPIRYQPDNRKIDHAARSAGISEGKAVKIGVHQDRRLKNRDQLSQ